ncbi:hypothetical protein ACOSQ2_018077 [Xanthoceras sorbifolium]
MDWLLMGNCLRKVKLRSQFVVDVVCEVDTKSSNLSFLYEPPVVAEVDESGTEEEQAAFVKEVEIFNEDSSLEFKHPKF